MAPPSAPSCDGTQAVRGRGRAVFELTHILLPYLFVLATPGPNLFLVLRASMAPAMRPALETASGIALGAGVAAFCAGFVTAGMPQSPLVEIAGRVIVAVLLLRMGWRTLRAGTRPGMPTAPATQDRHFITGLMTALCNPMSISFFAGVFIGYIPGKGPLVWIPASLTVMAEAGLWFLVLAALFRHRRFRRAFLLSEPYLRPVIGCALLIFAGKMIAPLI